MKKYFFKKSLGFTIVLLVFIFTFAPIPSGINIANNKKTSNGEWERFEYGQYPGEEPYGLGDYYLSAGCDLSEEASYITKDINLDGLSIATIGFSYYFSGHGVAIVAIYSGGHGSSYWEETIFFLQSSSPQQIDDFETTISPDSYYDSSEVYLEFYYFNDYGPSFPSFSIDDVYINEIGYFYSFEVNDGTLSGYVTDPLLNPIEGALIKVYFHGTYEEDCSDENGYYHVTNIPICYCMKNCTCSKEGYKTEWVLLGISENTTYDFILYPDDPYPIFNGSQCNGWFNSLVTASFVFDPENVAEIWYRYNGSNWISYLEPFIISEEGFFNFEWHWFDFEGIQSYIYDLDLYIDRTPPDFYIEKEKIGFNKWSILITTWDNLSGMDFAEFYINGVLMHIDDAPPYEFFYITSHNYKFKVMSYDIACNIGEISISFTKNIFYKSIVSNFLLLKNRFLFK